VKIFFLSPSLILKLEGKSFDCLSESWIFFPGRYFDWSQKHFSPGPNNADTYETDNTKRSHYGWSEYVSHQYFHRIFLIFDKFPEAQFLSHTKIATVSIAAFAINLLGIPRLTNFPTADRLHGHTHDLLTGTFDLRNHDHILHRQANHRQKDDHGDWEGQPAAKLLKEGTKHHVHFILQDYIYLFLLKRGKI
jgi:hypothetical protein